MPEHTPHGHGLKLRNNVPPRALSNEQVREVRLSMEPGPRLAARLGVDPNTVANARAGRGAYPPLAPDEKRAQAARAKVVDHKSYPLDELVIGQTYTRGGLRDLDRQEMLDAAHECRHGRLPADRTPSCGCWPQEITKTNPTIEEASNGSHRANLGAVAG